MLACLVKRAQSKDKRNKAGDEKEDGVLSDDGMGLWGRIRQLLRRVYEEVY